MSFDVEISLLEKNIKIRYCY